MLIGANNSRWKLNSWTKSPSEYVVRYCTHDEPDIESFWYYRKDKITTTGTEGSGAGKATLELGEEILGGIAAELIKWVEGALGEDTPKFR